MAIETKKKLLLNTNVNFEFVNTHGKFSICIDICNLYKYFNLFYVKAVKCNNVFCYSAEQNI